MTKQEFLGFLKMEVDEEKQNKQNYKLLLRCIEEELTGYSDRIEIETDKRLRNVWKAIEDYARNHKSGNCGACSDKQAIEIAMKLFNLSEAEKLSAEEQSQQVDELDLGDLLA